jgi:glucose/arabinose dehydrogenase
VLALLATAAALSAGAPAAVQLEPIARFDQPVAAAAAPSDRRRVFVAERSGRVRVLRDGRLLPRPFLDLRPAVEIRSPSIRLDQGGFLSLAFAPDYARSRRLYVLYTDRSDQLRIDEFRRSPTSPDRADAATRRLVLAIPRTAPVDVAGHLAFGPGGLLFASFGEGSSADASQDLSTLAGKLIRIDPRVGGGQPYTVPAGNPFVTTPGARPEIWALGLRVPWRFSFDRGGLALADVGDGRVEEVDYAPAGTGTGAGANYGWPFLEGDRRKRPGGEGLTAPVLTRRHGPRVCALIGGLVVRDTRLPSLRGRYLYGDFCTGEVRSARLGLPRAAGDRREPVTVPGLDAFTPDARGRIYAVSVLGPVYRLDPGR